MGAMQGMLPLLLLGGGRRGGLFGGGLMKKVMMYILTGKNIMMSMLMGGRFSMKDFLILPMIAPMFEGMFGGTGFSLPGFG